MELSAETVALVGVVIGVVEVIKRTAPELPKRFVPALSVLLGLLFGVFMGIGWFEGLVLGLAAGGTYDTAKISVLDR